MENLETALEPESTRTKLKRELRAEAMTRLEEAARTEADFENVVACWDKLDANRERKERYHEPIQGDMAMEYELKYNGKLFPEWMCGANYTSVRQGRYLDVIFNCPHELYEMTGHPILSKTFQELDSFQNVNNTKIPTVSPPIKRETTVGIQCCIHRSVMVSPSHITLTRFRNRICSLPRFPHTGKVKSFVASISHDIPKIQHKRFS